MTDILFDSPDNPLPANAAVGTFTTRDGKRLRYALFGAAARPLRGTVVLLQGRNEMVEKYFETIVGLAALGFNVATYDMRGQGGSQRLLRNPLKGHVRTFADHVADLEQFFEDIVLADSPAPYFILAHSTGGLVALLAAPWMANRISRMVLSAPLLEFAAVSASLRTARAVSGLLCRLGAGTASMTRGNLSGRPPPFDGNVLTSDTARYARNRAIVERHPELGLAGPTAAWVRAVFDAVDQVEDRDFMARIRTPALLIAAGADRVVSVRAIEDYARRLRAGGVLTIDGARHELMQEADVFREQFLAAFDAFTAGPPAGHAQ